MIHENEKDNWMFQNQGSLVNLEISNTFQWWALYHTEKEVCTCMYYTSERLHPTIFNTFIFSQ